MHELIENAISIVRGILRFRWTMLFVATSLSFIGWAYVYQMNDVYQAKARVFVDSNQILKPLLKGITVQPDVNQRVTLMSKTLLNRPNIEKLVRMADIDIYATSDLEKEQLINRLSREIRLNGDRNNSSLYTVQYTHQNPEIAKRLVQSLITVFIESTVGDEREDSETAQRFLTQQIEIYEGRLKEAEQRLSRFKRENAGKMPGESGGYYQRLDSTQARLRSAQLELNEVKNRRNALQRQINNESSTVSSGSIPIYSPLDDQLRIQRNELASLLIRYTDRHPKVAQLSESIIELERLRELSLREGANSESNRLNLVSSPVYQEMRRLLSESDARVAELEVRVQEYNKQTNELTSTVDSIPKVEAELQQLDRDYNIIKSQFETLLGRRESARLSEQVEQNVDDIKFRVIDPPFVPSRPTAPNKLLLTAGAFAAALGVSAALAFGLSLLRPVFYSADSVARKTGREVFGSVSLQRSSRTKFANFASWLVYFILVGLLLAAFAFMIATHSGMIEPDQFRNLVSAKLSLLLNALPFDAMNLFNNVFKVLDRFMGAAV